jgi:hypothetical protein
MNYEQSANNQILGAAGNNNVQSAKLAYAVMPLVELLTSNEFSWDDRERISSAIRILTRIHNGRVSEQAKMLGGLQAAAGQARQGALG